jgi:hypothetical protein
MLHVVERNGRWHVYETATEPWVLVTAFHTEDQARAYVGAGGYKADVHDVKVSGWFAAILQEDRSCIDCLRHLQAGGEVHVRSISVLSQKRGTETTFEVKCLIHTRTRFKRDEPL